LAELYISGCGRTFMNGRLVEGPTMQRADWEGELGRWLEPLLERLGHQARRRMLIGPGDGKSVAPVAERFAPGGL
jgi:hypothetical protein